MQAVVALISTLAERGIRLEVEAGTVYADPAGLLAEADRDAIRTHKAEIVSHLAAEARVGTVDPEPQDLRPAEATKIGPVATNARVAGGSHPFGPPLAQPDDAADLVAWLEALDLSLLPPAGFNLRPLGTTAVRVTDPRRCVDALLRDLARPCHPRYRPALIDARDLRRIVEGGHA